MTPEQDELRTLAQALCDQLESVIVEAMRPAITPIEIKRVLTAAAFATSNLAALYLAALEDITDPDVLASRMRDAPWQTFAEAAVHEYKRRLATAPKGDA